MFVSTTTKKRLSLLLLLAIVANLLSVDGYGSFYNYFPSAFHSSLTVNSTVNKSNTIIFEEVDVEESIDYSIALPKYAVKFDLKSTNQLAKHQLNSINKVASTKHIATQQTFLLYQYQFSEEGEIRS